jgi:hypothetical protein
MIDGESHGVAFHYYPDVVREIWQQERPRDICEIGGGRSPLFSPSDVEALGGRFTVLDIAPSELERAPASFTKVVADIGAPLTGTELAPSSYDFMFSKFVAEHVRHGKQMHSNVFELLRPGGLAFHFFPTLYHPAFVANVLLPATLSRRVLFSAIRRSERDSKFAPREADSKFPAYYSWCRGPSRAMRTAISSIGFEIVHFKAFYGTSYLKNVPLLSSAEEWFSHTTERRQLIGLSSYAYLVVRRPS